MGIFEKIAKSDATVKGNMKKEAFLGSALKMIGGLVKRHPVAAVTGAVNASDVASRTAQAQQTVRDAKNRANMINMNRRV